MNWKAYIEVYIYVECISILEYRDGVSELQKLFYLIFNWHRRTLIVDTRILPGYKRYMNIKFFYNLGSKQKELKEQTKIEIYFKWCESVSK